MTLSARTGRAWAALAVGSALLYLSQKQAQSQTDAHSVRAQEASLPSLGLVSEDAARITKLELALPATDDSPAAQITLEKRAVGWRITTPIVGAASAAKVAALLENLTQLRLSERIDAANGDYQRFELRAEQAVHVTAWCGPKKASELYFGKSSARGQLLRLAGTSGTFAIQSGGPHSYAGYLYTRAPRAWRETTIFQFEPSSAVAVRVDNPSGRFWFHRSKQGWSGERRLRRADGSLADSEKPWKAFDGARVDALLAAFKSLSADEFGRDEDRAVAGLVHAEQSGGVLRIELANPARELVVRIGNTARGPSDWAIKDSRWAVLVGGDGTLYALASWTCDWVTNGSSQFELQRVSHFPAAR